MAIPAGVALGASMLPGLMQLFMKPKQSTMTPAMYQQFIQAMYKMLVQGPVGQSMMNEASLSGNLAQRGYDQRAAASGMADSSMGQIAGAGAASMGAMNRMKVLETLFKASAGMASEGLQGQQQNNQFDWNNPSGMRAFAGSLGTSLFPLLMGAGGKQKPLTSGPIIDSNSGWQPSQPRLA